MVTVALNIAHFAITEMNINTAAACTHIACGFLNLIRDFRRILDNWFNTHNFAPKNQPSSRPAIAANAKDANRAAGGSDRLVKIIGIAPPRTSPAARPPPNQTSDLNRILPDTISGTTRPSAIPATGPSTPLMATAFGDTAKSNDSGPAKSAFISMAPARNAISAASPLDGIAGKIDSVADKTAIRG